MQHLFPALMIGLSVVIANPAASARDLSASAELSAAAKKENKKKKSKQYVYVRRAQPVYIRHPWMDPSIGPDGRPYPNPYPPGTCSEDLGYGRFAPCTFRN